MIAEHYEEVMFLDGSAADAELDLLHSHGADTVIQQMASDYHIPGLHKPAQEPFGAPADDFHESACGQYVLSWNIKLNYIGLAAKRHG